MVSPWASKSVHEVMKAGPEEFITLAQIRTMPGENRPRHVLVVQAYLMDHAMKTLDAEGHFDFFAYFDAREARAEVKPDFQWSFAAREAEGFRTRQRFGSGYCFLLPVPESEMKSSTVTVIARYVLPSGRKFVSTNHIANVPVTAQYDRTTTRSAIPKSPAESEIPRVDPPSSSTPDEMDVIELAIEKIADEDGGSSNAKGPK